MGIGSRTRSRALRAVGIGGEMITTRPFGECVLVFVFRFGFCLVLLLFFAFSRIVSQYKYLIGALVALKAQMLTWKGLSGPRK